MSMDPPQRLHYPLKVAFLFGIPLMMSLLVCLHCADARAATEEPRRDPDLPGQRRVRWHCRHGQPEPPQTPLKPDRGSSCGPSCPHACNPQLFLAPGSAEMALRSERGPFSEVEDTRMSRA